MSALNYVHIESSTACNATCKMCPHSQISRRGSMKYELFTSIVDQAVDLGCMAFTLFRLGEPLLFPDLFKWMDYLRHKGAGTALYTNGAELTPDVASRLNDYVDVIGEVTISFHGYDEESYSSMMGLDFNKVYNRVKAFAEDTPLALGIYMVANDPTDQELSSKFTALWEGVRVERGVGICNFMEWAGSIEGFRTLRTQIDEGIPMERVPCIRVLNEIDVMYDGTVCLCCLDAHGEITFGNLNSSSLQEVLDHKLRKYYQEKHLIGAAEELPLCKFCSTSMVVKE